MAAVATGQVLASGGVGVAPAYTATPTVTSITFGSGSAFSTYAEGTWVPTLDGTISGVTTYSIQTGYYTRIGNLVWCTFVAVGSAATGTGTIVFGDCHSL